MFEDGYSNNNQSNSQSQKLVQIIDDIKSFGSYSCDQIQQNNDSYGSLEERKVEKSISKSQFVPEKEEDDKVHNFSFKPHKRVPGVSSSLKSDEEPENDENQDHIEMSLAKLSIHKKRKLNILLANDNSF